VEVKGGQTLEHEVRPFEECNLLGDFLNDEVMPLLAIQQPNLVRLLGCCIYSDELIQVYESLPNGSLSQAFSCAYPSSYRFDSHVLSIGTFMQVAFE
jgi:hypothetical protein